MASASAAQQNEPICHTDHADTGHSLQCACRHHTCDGSLHAVRSSERPSPATQQRLGALQACNQNGRERVAFFAGMATHAGTLALAPVVAAPHTALCSNPRLKVPHTKLTKLPSARSLAVLFSCGPGTGRVLPELPYGTRGKATAGQERTGADQLQKLAKRFELKFTTACPSPLPLVGSRGCRHSATVGRNHAMHPPDRALLCPLGQVDPA